MITFDRVLNLVKEAWLNGIRCAFFPSVANQPSASHSNGYQEIEIGTKLSAATGNDGGNEAGAKCEIEQGINLRLLAAARVKRKRKSWTALENKFVFISPKMDGSTDHPIRERDSIFWSESGE